MKEQLEARLDELKKEFEAGQEMLKEHDKQRNDLYQKLVRISGAIQVLEEELSKQEQAPVSENITEIRKQEDQEAVS